MLLVILALVLSVCTAYAGDAEDIIGDTADIDDGVSDDSILSSPIEVDDNVNDEDTVGLDEPDNNIIGNESGESGNGSGGQDTNPAGNGTTEQGNGTGNGTGSQGTDPAGNGTTEQGNDTGNETGEQISNGTDVQTNTTETDNNQNTPTNNNKNTKTTNWITIHNFSELFNAIKATKNNGVLYITGTIKYNPKKDKAYKNGVKIYQNIKIVGKNCVMDGAGKARLIIVASVHKVTFENIAFKNGYATDDGGAILLNPGSKLIIKKCTFQNNKAYKSNGGAIAARTKTLLEIHNSKFIKNKALRESKKKWPVEKRGMGGAIISSAGSTLKLYDSTFKSNNAYVTTVLLMSFTEATGIKTSTAYVKNCVFEKNTATMNGAFYLDEYGKGTFIKTKFINNKATKEGGILILDGSKKATVKGCTFTKNSGYVGSAIVLFKFNKQVSHATITGCTFTKNTARESGGAIYSDCGQFKVINSKFIGNKAKTTGGAIWAQSGTVKLKSTLFKQNKAKWGGAILIKNKKSIVASKCKFVKNIGTKNGPNIFGLTNGKVVKVKVKSK